MCLDFDVKDNMRWTFFTEASIIMDYKLILMMDLSLLSSSDVNWWTVDYCDVFISSHSDGTHSLQSIIDETHFSKSDEETNSG